MRKTLFSITMLLGLMAVSHSATAQNQSWTADNGNGTFTNPLFYDEFPTPTFCAWVTTIIWPAPPCTRCPDWSSYIPRTW